MDFNMIENASFVKQQGISSGISTPRESTGTRKETEAEVLQNKADETVESRKSKIADDITKAGKSIREILLDIPHVAQETEKEPQEKNVFKAQRQLLKDPSLWNIETGDNLESFEKLTNSIKTYCNASQELNTREQLPFKELELMAIQHQGRKEPDAEGKHHFLPDQQGHLGFKKDDFKPFGNSGGDAGLKDNVGQTGDSKDSGGKDAGTEDTGKKDTDGKDAGDKSTGNKDAGEDKRVQQAEAAVKDQKAKEDDTRRKNQEKAQETTEKIKSISSKIEELENSVNCQERDLENLIRDIADDPSFDPGPIQFEIYRKKTELEKLKTERDQLKLELEQLRGTSVDNSSLSTYAIDYTMSRNTLEMEKDDTTSYKIRESLKQNLESIKSNHPGVLSPDTVTSYMHTENPLETAKVLENLREYIQEDKSREG